MRTREDLKKELLHALENKIRVWSGDTTGCSESVVESELKSSNHVIENIDEATSIATVQEATRLLYLYASDQMNLAYNNRGIEKGDQIDNLLHSINVPKVTLSGLKNSSLWDECVQKLYEAMGYTTTLPTHSEIKNIELEIEKLKATGADDSAIIDLEEQLNLKKCALGELPDQWSGGIPVRLSDNIRRTAQIERETHQIEVQSSLNTSSPARK